MSVKMESVESSNITSVGYDSATLVLTVEFKNGGTYEYAGVSPIQHRALMNSGSVGQFLHHHIKPYHKASKRP